jgi:diadenosine tetraphosphatase ApaH/serine/threonine PP2A family protein phosphatase
MVMNRVRRKKFDLVVCLGDFVGYGAQPNQILDTMRTMKAPKLYIRGNHDRVAAGLDHADGFNTAAKAAALWTRDHLSARNRHFLETLPLGPIEREGVLVCHGAPHNEDEYVFHEGHAMEVFESTTAPIILYGHTHLPVIFSLDRQHRVHGVAVRGDVVVRLDSEHRYLINPGSVGQPRDRNPASSFVIFDSKRLTVQFFRVAYDVGKTQGSILKAGLPPILAQRLAYGT